MRTLAIAAAFLFTQLASVQGARASEATPSGLSVGVGLDMFYDGTVTDRSGNSVHDRSGLLDLGVLANFGDFAVGGGLGWAPGIFGDGRLLVGARAGWQPTIGTTRVHLLWEIGVHRYTHVEEGLFSVSTPDFFSTTYVGAQIGITRELVKDGGFEYGVALFLRQDMDQQPFVHQEESFLGGTNPPPTDLIVGGTMIGASVTLGFRVDRASIEFMKRPHEFGR